MNIQILNKFEQSNGKWSYKGQFMYNGNWVPISGTIERPESKSRFKQILREKVERQIKEYIDSRKPPKTFEVPAEGVFVDALS